MRYKKLDLNLLVALASLLRTGNVSETARQLNLSQPAMSNALARLRQFFGDELLVPMGRRMQLTGYAETLAPLVRGIIENVDALVATSSDFDPATSHRTFRIGASDYIATVLLVPLLRDLALRAPNVRIEIEPPGPELIPRLNEGKLDLILTPDEFVSDDHPSDLLFEEEHVVVGWSGNPVFDAPLDEAGFFAHGHVAVAIGPSHQPPFGERLLARAERTRRIEAVAFSFTMVPWLISGTMRLAVMHKRLADAMAPLLSLRWAPLPFDFPKMREMIQAHRALLHEPGVAWLREEILRASRTTP